MSDMPVAENETQSEEVYEQDSSCILSVDELKDFLSHIYGKIDILAVGIPAWVFVVLVAVGLTFNAINIIVFTRRPMKSPINYLLTCLEGVNVFIFITFIPDIVYAYLPEFYYTNVGAITEHFNVCITIGAIFLSNWFTVVASVWRLIAVTRPFTSRKWCSKRRAVTVVIGMSVLATVFGFVFYFVNQVSEVRCTVYDVNLTMELIFHFMMSSSKIVNYDITGKIGSAIILLCTTIPCVITIIMTGLLIFHLWMAKRKRQHMVSDDNSKSKRQEEKITITLILILCLMIVAYIPDSVINMFPLLNISEENSDWLTLWVKIAHCKIGILGCNCITFLVYFFMSVRFRKTFYDTFSSTHLLKIRNSNTTESISSTKVEFTSV